MRPLYIILIIVGIIAVLLTILYFLGRKLQKKQDEQKSLLEANKQTVSLLVIDKKRMKLKDATLPAAITEQIPKMSKNLKVPLVKVKIGPQIMTMFCDEEVLELIPWKK